MATYVATAQQTFPSTSTPSWATKYIAIAPTTYEVLVGRVELSYVGVTGLVSGWSLSVDRNDSSTLSGGSSLTPVTLRGGGPAATSTVKSGTPTISGTPFNYFESSQAIPVTREFLYDLTVPAGSVFSVSVHGGGNSVTSTVSFSVYFEELRLSWHY